VHAVGPDLVARLAARATVVEIGATAPGSAAPPDGSYVDLRGRMTLPELVAAIAAADLLVTPETGPMQIAAAVGTPAVVIYGGYIDPAATGYPANIDLYSPVECAPCWLRTPCPYGKKCLHQITPDQVEAAVDRLLADAPRPAEARCEAR
jgi:ADP-heptose:LPS heptosyltransferase